MIVSGYTSINAVAKAELFLTSIRATGALTVSIFGGTAESIGIIAISLLVYVFMRETKKDSAMNRYT
jgi:MFS transporter, MHS family, alpha-ketoglutarate permease